MAATAKSGRMARYTEALLFWAITFVVCVVAGYGSYRYGRSWIGDRLGKDVKSVLTTQEITNRISAHAFTDTGKEDTSEVPEEPPDELVVEVKPTAVDAKSKPESGATATVHRVEPPERDADEAEEDAEPDAAVFREGGEGSASRGDSSSTAQRSSTVLEPPVTREQGARYVVRAGSFRDRKNAERAVQDLRAKGYKSYTTKVVVDGIEYTRVNVGSYEDEEEARRVRGELRGEGYTDANLSVE
ncbi:MAG: SPOR domain-containing protein [Candidatus Zipacnadales bacterium]